MDQRVIDLYDDYVHTHFDRRLFLERAGKLMGSSAAATAALAALKSDYARAAIVPENDSRITIERISFTGASGPVKAYLAKPKAAGRHGAVIVAHQNRGLNPHIEDITRRLAAEGYVALGVDFMAQVGGTPPTDEEAMKLFGSLDMTKAQADAKAAADWLRARPDVNGKVGIIGFCWGGGVVGLLAVADPMLVAGSVFYGVPPKAEDVSKIKATLLLNYADAKLDARIGDQVPAFETALKAANVKYTRYFYEGANHAFNDDTQAPRYNEAAAKLAWQRTLDLFKATLT